MGEEGASVLFVIGADANVEVAYRMGTVATVPTNARTVFSLHENLRGVQAIVSAAGATVVPGQDDALFAPTETPLVVELNSQWQPQATLLTGVPMAGAPFASAATADGILRLAAVTPKVPSVTSGILFASTLSASMEPTAPVIFAEHADAVEGLSLAWLGDDTVIGLAFSGALQLGEHAFRTQGRRESVLFRGAMSAEITK